jgi:hypothetical protein
VIEGNLRSAVLFIGIVLSCSLPLCARQEAQRIPGSQDYPGLDIQAAVGWEDFSHAHHPLAVSLMITNSSATLLEGRMVLRNPETGETRILGDVAVGPGGKRHFGSVAALGGWDLADVSWEGSEAVLWTRRLTVPGDVDATASFATPAGLFVEDGGRRLVLPQLRPVLSQSAFLNRLANTGADPALENEVTTRGIVAELTTIPPWQLPIHEGSLTSVRTVLLSPQLSPESLTDAQYRAIGRWTAMGGVLILAKESEGIRTRLQEHLPLKPRPPFEQNGLETEPCGLGAICHFQQAEFSQADSATVASIGEVAATAAASPLFAKLREKQMYDSDEAPLADLANTSILALFAIYAAAAAAPIVMFRSSRRWLAGWVIAVVLAAAVGAAVVGVAIGRSRGDLAIRTLTWIGEDCLVQAASLKLTCAGQGDLFQGVRGREPELQPDANSTVDPLLLNQSFMLHADFADVSLPEWPAFNLTKSTSEDPALSRIPVLLSPWSSRRATAVDMAPLQGRLEVMLEAVGGETQDSMEKWNLAASFPNGPLRLRLKNSLPFRLSACRLGMLLWGRPANSEGMWMLYRTIVDVPDLEVAADPAAEPKELVITPGFEWVADYGGQSLRYVAMSSMVPPGETEVWLEGRIEASPLMQPEGDDFRASSPGEHWFHYRVPRANQPKFWREMQDWKDQK